MKRIVCTCSCGQESWSMDFDDGKEGFTLYEGIADDCEACNKQRNNIKPSGGVDFKKAMHDVKPIPKRGRGR